MFLRVGQSVSWVQLAVDPGTVRIGGPKTRTSSPLRRSSRAAGQGRPTPWPRCHTEEAMDWRAYLGPCPGRSAAVAARKFAADLRGQGGAASKSGSSTSTTATAWRAAAGGQHDREPGGRRSTRPPRRCCSMRRSRRAPHRRRLRATRPPRGFYQQRRPVRRLSCWVTARPTSTAIPAAAGRGGRSPRGGAPGTAMMIATARPGRRQGQGEPGTTPTRATTPTPARPCGYGQRAGRLPATRRNRPRARTSLPAGPRTARCRTGGYDNDQRDEEFLPGFGSRGGYDGGGPQGRDDRYDHGDGYGTGYDDRRGQRAAGPSTVSSRAAGDRRDDWDDRNAAAQEGDRRMAAEDLVLAVVAAIDRHSSAASTSRASTTATTATSAGQGTGEVTVQVKSGDTAFSLAPRLLQADVIASIGVYPTRPQQHKHGRPGAGLLPAARPHAGEPRLRH